MGWDTEPDAPPPLVAVAVQDVPPQGLGDRWPFPVILWRANQSRQVSQSMVDGDLLHVPVPEEE